MLPRIAERDGYRCHLCGRKVDMSLSGKDPNGPQADHLTPRSEGGSDDPQNLRLSHALCNQKRQAGGEVQLILACVA